MVSGDVWRGVHFEEQAYASRLAGSGTIGDDAWMMRSLSLVMGLLVLVGCRASSKIAADGLAADPPASSVPAAAPAAPVEFTTPEGLVIRDEVVGTGEPCPPDATVTINFTAALAGGEVYDSSARRKRSLTFALGSPGLIRGLREGIPGMQLGGKRHLRIPWSMAYGEHGRDPIPPRTDLEFDIELLAIDAAKK